MPVAARTTTLTTTLTLNLIPLFLVPPVWLESVAAGLKPHADLFGGGAGLGGLLKFS